MARGEISDRTTEKAANGEMHDGDEPIEAEILEPETPGGGELDHAEAESADAAAVAEELTASPETPPPVPEDIDPAETQEWLDSLRYVLESKGPERVSYLLSVLDEKAHRSGVELPFTATTPYINT